MGTVSYSATARVGLPVEYRFRCAKCGKEVRTTRYLQLSEQSDQNGAASSVEYQARIKLAGNMGAQLKQAAQNAAEGAILMSASPNHPLPLTPLVCPNCELANWPRAWYLSSTLRPRWFLFSLLAWPIAMLALWLFSMDWQIHQSRLPGWVFPAMFGLAIAYIVLFIVFNHKLAKKAIDHPKLLEKFYKCVINDEIDVDMTKYDLGVIRVGSRPRQ